MGTRANYTNRELNEAEREFATDNYSLIRRFCYAKKLNYNEWEEKLAIQYLQSVKKYFELEKLHKFSFNSILYNDLWRTWGNYRRAENRKKRMPEGGIVSLDYELEDKNNTIMYFAQSSVDVDAQLSYRELIAELSAALNQTQSIILTMLYQGYTRKQMAQRTNQSIWHLNNEIKNIRQLTAQILKNNAEYQEVTK